MGPNGILCTRWEKEYASVRQTFVSCDDCLVKNEAYDAEKKAHTSKRVSIIACNNVISKAQLCAVGKLWIKYLNFGCKPKYNFLPSAKNITVCNANGITKIARCF